MCSNTPEAAKVGNSYSLMRGPGIDSWFSDRSNYSHWSFEAAVLPINPNIYADHCEQIVIYHFNYCRTRCWQSQLRFVRWPLLLHLRLLGTFQSDISHLTLTWPAKHWPNQGWGSTPRLHLYALGCVFTLPGWCITCGTALSRISIDQYKTEINIGSGKVLLPPGNKSFPNDDSILCRHMAGVTRPHWVSDCAEVSAVCIYNNCSMLRS